MGLRGLTWRLSAVPFVAIASVSPNLVLCLEIPAEWDDRHDLRIPETYHILVPRPYMIAKLCHIDPHLRISSEVVTLGRGRVSNSTLQNCIMQHNDHIVCRRLSLVMSALTCFVPASWIQCSWGVGPVSSVFRLVLSTLQSSPLSHLV